MLFTLSWWVGSVLDRAAMETGLSRFVRRSPSKGEARGVLKERSEEARGWPAVKKRSRHGVM
jgi:hypothetical protein